jgi:SET family sugar efflux transporter-like MFS transporter
MTTPVAEAESPARSPNALAQIGRALTHLLRTPGLRMLLACNLVLGMAVSFVLPFMSLFCTDVVGMSLTGFGLFMTASALANIAISTWLSNLSDSRYSRRSLMLWGAASGALAYGSFAWLRSPWHLFLVSAVLVSVASITFSQMFAHARELVGRSLVPKNDVPLYMNVVRMAFALAWTVGPAVAAFTLERFSFVGLFGCAGLLYVALFALIFWSVRGEPPPPVVAVGASTERPKLRGVWAAPGVLAWFLAITLMLAAHGMSLNNMSLLVIRVLGGSETDVGIIFSLAPIFELPSMLYVGVLATRMPSERLIRIAMLLAGLYYLGLALVQAPYQIYPLQLISAAIVSVTSGIAITFFQSKLPEQLGAATNLYSNASRLGSTSGYLMFGVVASRFGHRGVAVACSVLALSALGLTALAGSREDQGGVTIDG